MDNSLKQHKSFHKVLIALLCSIIAVILSYIGFIVNNITFWAILTFGIIVFVFVLYLLFVNRYRMLMRISLVALVSSSWINNFFSAKLTVGENVFFDIIIKMSDNIEPVHLTICVVCMAIMDFSVNHFMPYLNNRNRPSENNEIKELFDLFNEAGNPEQPPITMQLKIAELLKRLPYLEKNLKKVKAIIQSPDNESDIKIIERIQEIPITKQINENHRPVLSEKFQKSIPRVKGSGKIKSKDLRKFLLPLGYIFHDIRSHFAVVGHPKKPSMKKPVVMIPKKYFQQNQFIPNSFLELIMKTFDLSPDIFNEK